MSREILIAIILITMLLPIKAHTQSPGDTVGWTIYDVQSVGSTGRRIAVNNDGGIHFAWTMRSPGLINRYANYNYRTSSGYWGWGQTGTSVDRGSYPQIAVSPGDRACIAYHNASVETLFCAIDAAPGAGIFDYYRPPNRWGGIYLMWPSMTIDISGNIHLVSTQAAQIAGELQQVGYTRSENGGASWSSLAHVDTVMTISSIVASSPVSDKVAIVYAHPIYGDSSQMLNDVYYVQSNDGTTWDWNGGKIDVTNYGFPDSLFAYTDLDALYDYNDNLHIFWNATYIIPGQERYCALLFHCDTEFGIISEVASVPEWDNTGCDLGPWALPICKMTSSVDSATGLFYLAFVSFTADDCSGGGKANGEIYMYYSVTNGQNWIYGGNLTNSYTPGCNYGTCDNDIYPSFANKTSDNQLHLFYLNEKLGGGSSPEEWDGSPLRYMAIPAHPDNADDLPAPTTFSLSQNYPNPFNAKTKIDFELKNDSDVRLEIFNITGARVATLIADALNAGPHSIVWDASRASSGIYYYSLKAGDEEQTKRMVLIK